MIFNSEVFFNFKQKFCVNYHQELDFTSARLISSHCTLKFAVEVINLFIIAG